MTKSLILPDPEHTSKRFIRAVLRCASLCIPSGQRKKFTPFWNDKLQKLKEERDKARRKAYCTGLSEDCVALRKAQSFLKRLIIV